MDDFIKTYGISKRQVNRIRKLFEVPLPGEAVSSRNGAERKKTATTGLKNGNASTKTGARLSRARKPKSAKKDR